MRFIIYLLICLSVNCEKNNSIFPNCKECSKNYSYKDNDNDMLSILNNKIYNIRSSINSNVNKMKCEFNKYFTNDEKCVKNNIYSEEDINTLKILLLLQI